MTRLATWCLSGPRLPIVFAAVYALAYLIPFPLLTWYAIPKASFASITQLSFWAAIGLAMAALILTLLYLRLWNIARHRPDRSTIVMILAGWLAASIILLFTFPGQSSDLGDYTFHAHMLAHLGQNPLTTPPSAVIAYDANPYIGWYTEVNPYGPVWNGLAAGLHALVGESYLANLLAFKALAIAATAISGGLIYVILRRIDPRYAAAGLALWLWNPLVLNEGALHGHNDLVMIAVIMIGLWLAVRRHETLGIIVLVAAGLIKLQAWLMIPIVAVWLVREHDWRAALSRLIPAAIGGVALVWLTYAPFGGWWLLPRVVQDRSWWSTGTWTAAVFAYARNSLHWTRDVTIRDVIGGASLMFAIIAGGLMLKIRDLRLEAWAVVLAYLLVGAHYFQPWYVTWLMALTATLAANQRIALYSSLFTYFMLLHPIVAQYLAPRLGLPDGGYDMVMAAATLLVPQIAALGLIVLSTRSARSHRLETRRADSLL